MILFINGHPAKQSLSKSIIDSYTKGLSEKNKAFEVIHLGDLKFDPILRTGFKEQQPLEPDLLAAQEKIKRAKHIVIVYPQWWGSAPALLKGFIDRTLLPGFAFKYRPNSSLWDKLLVGKTAEIWLTSDGPKFYYFFYYLNSPIRWLKTATLEFCGIKTLAVHHLDSVKSKSPNQITAFLEQAYKAGLKF